MHGAFFNDALSDRYMERLLCFQLIRTNISISVAVFGYCEHVAYLRVDACKSERAANSASDSLSGNPVSVP